RRALLLREIAASVFKAADATVLLQGMTVPIAMFDDTYVDARFDYDGSKVAVVRRLDMTVEPSTGRGSEIPIPVTGQGIPVFVGHTGQYLAVADPVVVSVFDLDAGADPKFGPEIVDQVHKG